MSSPSEVEHAYQEAVRLVVMLAEARPRVFLRAVMLRQALYRELVRQKLRERAPKLSKQAMAVGLLSEHPEWSDTKIAKRVGCARTSLYEMPRYVLARAALKAGREQRRE